jgi:hypothetical protein
VQAATQLRLLSESREEIAERRAVAARKYRSANHMSTEHRVDLLLDYLAASYDELREDRG